MNYEPHYKLCDDILKCINLPEMPDVSINDHLGEPKNQQIGALYTLENDGYIIRHIHINVFHCRITTKGVAFIETGGYKVMLPEIEHKKQLELSTIKFNRDNAAFQKRYGNPILIANVLIAILSLITSVVVTIYIAKEEQPAINNITVIVDSTFCYNNNLNNDTSYHLELKK